MTHRLCGSRDALTLRRCSLGRSPAGFTLVEVLASLIIILMLASLLLPAVQRAREASRQVMCRSNLTQIGVALNNYMMAHDVLPPGSTDSSGPVVSAEGAGYHMSWMAQILPYVEHNSMYEKIDFTKSVYDAINLPVRQRPIPVFICPSDGRTGSFGNPGASANYCGIHNDVELPIDVNQNGVLFLNSSVGADDIRDGCSNTMYVVEILSGLSGRLGWMSGTRATLRNAVVAKQVVQNLAEDGTVAVSLSDFQLHTSNSIGMPVQQETSLLAANQSYVGGPSSYHTGGFHVLMGDGAVRFISTSIDANAFRKMAHRADGELLETPF